MTSKAPTPPPEPTTEGEPMAKPISPPLPKGSDAYHVPDDLSESSRFEDMSRRGQLKVVRQRDGDMIVIVMPDPKSEDARLVPCGVTAEFCTLAGGGRSKRTHEALMALMIAMDQDNQENPQERS